MKMCNFLNIINEKYFRVSEFAIRYSVMADLCQTWLGLLRNVGSV